VRTAASPAVDPPVQRRRLILGRLVMAALITGFLFKEQIGLAAWQIALLVDVVLVALLPEVPWRRIPDNKPPRPLARRLAAAVATEAMLTEVVPSNSTALETLLVVPAV
jgi:hypothetical protein